MSPRTLETLYSDVVVDLRSEAHARALAELEQCACTVGLGEVMEVVSDDPSMSIDICSWAECRGYEYMGTVEEPGASRIFVRRTR
jgi:TusA-related sulfurtransferase